MKAKVRVLKEIEIEKILISISPRYIGDSDDDDVPSDFPGLKNGSWDAVVMIDTGEILGWPQGDEREMYCKVCDAGRYTLYSSGGESVASIDGYVPHGVVPGDYGDYVHLKIGADGIIKNWPSKPDVSEFFCSDED